MRLPNGQKIGDIPDCIFGIEYTGTDGKLVCAYHFLEADRGTMPVLRQNPSQFSFHRKLLAYQATWAQNLHRLRVLTATSTPERVQTLVVACRQLQRGQGLFLFTDAENLRAHSNPLALPWDSAREDAHEALLDCLIPGNSLPCT